MFDLGVGATHFARYFFWEECCDERGAVRWASVLQSYARGWATAVSRQGAGTFTVAPVVEGMWAEAQASGWDIFDAEAEREPDSSEGLLEGLPPAADRMRAADEEGRSHASNSVLASGAAAASFRFLRRLPPPSFCSQSSPLRPSLAQLHCEAAIAIVRRIRAALRPQQQPSPRRSPPFLLHRQ